MPEIPKSLGHSVNNRKIQLKESSDRFLIVFDTAKFSSRIFGLDRQFFMNDMMRRSQYGNDGRWTTGF